MSNDSQSHIHMNRQPDYLSIDLFSIMYLRNADYHPEYNRGQPQGYRGDTLWLPHTVSQGFVDPLDSMGTVCIGYVTRITSQYMEVGIPYR